MTKRPKRPKRPQKKLTVGELEDQLLGLYRKLALALHNPPPGQLDAIIEARTLISSVLDQINVQRLHQDAVLLGKLTTELQGATNQLVQLKNSLQQLAQVAALGASVLNTIGSILPLL